MSARNRHRPWFRVAPVTLEQFNAVAEVVYLGETYEQERFGAWRAIAHHHPWAPRPLLDLEKALVAAKNAESPRWFSADGVTWSRIDWVPVPR